MFDGLRYWWQMRALRTRQRKLREISRLVYPGSVAAAGEGFANHWHDISVVADKVADLQTRRLITQAEDLFLPTPPFIGDDGAIMTGNWEPSEAGPGYRLTARVRNELRQAVRAEQRDLRTAWMSWTPIFFGLPAP